MNQGLHRAVLLLLLRAKLLKTTDLDIYLAKSMDAGRNSFYIEFSIPLIRLVGLPVSIEPGCGGSVEPHRIADVLHLWGGCLAGR